MMMSGTYETKLSGLDMGVNNDYSARPHTVRESLTFGSK